MLNYKAGAMASLARQLEERAQDDALTPVMLSVEHAADLWDALSERNRVIAAMEKQMQRRTGPSAPFQMVLHMAALEAALGQSKVALGAMLTHMGMDEDEWTKPTFDQARAALRAIEEASC